MKNEPDKLNFSSHGLQCALRRGSMGAWCGYVAIPAKHPLFGVSYQEPHESLAALWKKRKGEPLGNAGMIPLLCCNDTPRMDVALTVHGSVTFTASNCPCEKPDGKWWIGFDCSHAGDASPKLPCMSGETYRTIDYAKQECEGLAGQLATIGNAPERS